MGNQLAIRRLSRKDGRPVVVRVGMPIRVRRDEWKCPISISGLGATVRRNAIGFDAIQTIMIAFATIRKVLQDSGLEITWAGGEPGDPGFPFYVSNVHGLEFTRRIEKKVQALLDAKTARLEQEHARRKSNGAKRKK